MHVPDGFLSPETYISLYAVNTPLWVYALKKVNKNLSKKKIPMYASLTAFAYIVSSIQFPIPGSTSIHLTGIPILALKLGLWNSYLVFSFIFFLQTIFLGLGGITSLPLNSISMGFFGTLSVVIIQKMFMNTKDLSVTNDAGVREVGRTIRTNVFIVLSAIAGILVSGIILGLILGLQPWIAKNAMGQPLFFPYSWNVVLPSILIGNIPVIILESIVTIPLYHFLNKMET